MILFGIILSAIFFQSNLSIFTILATGRGGITIFSPLQTDQAETEDKKKPGGFRPVFVCN